MTAINKITSSSFAQGISKKMGSLCSNIGDRLANTVDKAPNEDKFISKFLKTVEPTGANNPFVTLATLMIGTVIIPRVFTAGKRNPDNKEATRDEIKEILFRDCQTVLIILFALKSANSLIAGAATKFKGLPMINKPYEALFENKEKGFKGLKQKGEEIIQHPIKKLKTIGKNLLNTINPTGGVVALNNDEFISKYSGYSSLDEIKKLIDSMPSQGGDKEKVFKKIMDSLIQGQEDILNGSKTSTGLHAIAARTANQDGSIIEKTQNEINNAEAIKNALEKLREEGYESFSKNNNIDESIQNILVEFFKDKDNALVKEAKGLTAILKTFALAVETIYLGFGLPALNQKRLEKKYLKNNPDFKSKYKGNKAESKEIINKIIKPHEIKLYHQFLK